LRDLSAHVPQFLRGHAARHDGRAARRVAGRALRLDRRHRPFHHPVHPELRSHAAARIDRDPGGDGDPAQRDRPPRRGPLRPVAKLAHIPEKWAPVFRKGYAPTHESEAPMAAKLKLTVACGDYEIVRAIKDGVVEADGIELILLTGMGPRERHWRLARKMEFDVCEENVGAYFMARDQDEPLTAIPVFMHRR